MRTRPFGPQREPVAAIGQGTWRLKDPAAAVAALEEGIRLGMTHIDTAELYEQGSRSETVLGPIVARHRPRLFLASKVLPKNGSAKGVRAACLASLKRLQTDCLDLYYHHWREGSVPLDETLRALAGLVDDGRIRMVGVSNYDVGDLDQAESILGRGRLAANQVLYHLADRGIEAEVLPWCRRRKVTLVAYSPFGGDRVGFPAGKRAEVLDEVARGLGKTPRQVVLAFLLRFPEVVAIPKAERLEHVRENAGGDFDLPRDAVARLEEAFPLKPGLRVI
ncbi:MAG TPA: aldo/keto reductase [Candidatus Thermoplasmatota archaeon]|nr:aldo/keto reductase [Candidatus Thermoplasmatota archaeon]